MQGKSFKTCLIKMQVKDGPQNKLFYLDGSHKTNFDKKNEKINYNIARDQLKDRP